MGEVVVVGAGVAGLAVAVRLAKRRHHVTLVERLPRIGGALHRVEQDGFGWDAGPTSTLLPAVLRDLFRKSGRPLERYVDLQHRPVARRHVFVDGSVVDLPTGSRADQIAAVDAGLGAGTGHVWAAFVDSQADRWDRLRRDVLDPPDAGRRLADRDVATALAARTSLGSLVARALPDARLQQLAVHPFDLTGADPADLPAILATLPYVERTFGVWDSPDGMASVAAALETRLDERGVTVRGSAPVAAVVVDDGRAGGVRLADGELLRADAVVAAIDPRQVLTELLPRGAARAASRAYRGAVAARAPGVTHLGLRDLPAPLGGLPAEVVLHGDPTLVVTTTGTAPAGGSAWTVLTGAPGRTDPLEVLATHGLDVRPHVVVRLDRTVGEPDDPTAGAPYGLSWPGWRTYARRASVRSPLPGLHLAGAGAHPGPGLAFVGWGAAAVAATVDAALAGPTPPRR